MPSGIIVRLTEFRSSEDGVTSIEYAVIIAIISGVLLVALPTLGEAIGNPMTSLTSALAGGGDSGDGDGGDGGSDDDGGDDGDDGDHHDGDHGGDGEHD